MPGSKLSAAAGGDTAGFTRDDHGTPAYCTDEREMSETATMTNLPELMTPEETAAYLRLDAKDGNPKERLRNLIRRQRLPVASRGRLRLFRRTAVDAWLDGGRTQSPAR
ncbi:MAG: helix-turn-helix domain-containing protein [Pirellulaceae bacterium]